MIVPEPRQDETKQQRVAALTTTGLVGLAMLVIALVNVPEYTTTQDLYRELDPSRLVQLRPEPETEPEQPQEAEESEADEQETPEEAVEDATPQKAPERVDLSDVASQGLEVDLSPSETPSQRRSTAEEAEASGGNTTLRVEREDLGEMGGIEMFDDPSESAVPRGRNNRAATGADGTGIAVARSSGSGAGTSEGEGFDSGGEVVGGSQGRAGNMSGASVEVALKDMDEFGGDYENFEVRKLIEWMKQNPAELPVGVRRHVGYQSEHLSSAIPIEIGDTRYELYLMCKESLYEVHIVLVEENDTRYLVDRSFQKEGRLFRVGTARRDDDLIVGIQSRTEPLGERSEQFYQVFLSWWEEAKEEVE